MKDSTYHGRTAVQDSTIFVNSLRVNKSFYKHLYLLTQCQPFFFCPSFLTVLWSHFCVSIPNKKPLNKMYMKLG